MSSVDTDTKPTTHNGNLAKLPRALAPLLERDQWAVWRWTLVGGRWTKPPFQSREPQRHASTKSSDTWSDYVTALATVQAGDADGVTYILTNQDPFAAIDLDRCRDDYGSVDVWAQNFLGWARQTYAEISPSGTGLRIWGLTDGGPVNRKFLLAPSDKVPRVTVGAGFELFRRTHKALTVTGLDLRQGRTFGSIDRIFDWAVVIGERHKPQPATNGGVPFSGTATGSRYSIEQIDQILRYGAVEGANRSDLFHTLVGHFRGIGETPEAILARFEEFPNGIADRYVEEGRLAVEVIRSVGKYLGLAWTSDQIGIHLAQFSDGIGGHLISAGLLANASPKTHATKPKPDPDPDDDDELNDPDDDELDDDKLTPKPQQTGRTQISIHSWEEPDPSLLDDRRGELPEFPLETLSIPLQDWVKRAAFGTGVTHAHVAVPLLAIGSSVIGTARRVRASSSWSQPLTLWMALVGYSGSGKTPGIDASKLALRVVERSRGYKLDELRRRHDVKAETAKVAAAVWKEQVKEAVRSGTAVPAKPAEADDPGPFVVPRLFVSSVTIEKLGVLLTVRPQGLLYLADELSSLFLNMSRYSRGQDNEFWLEAWNGGGYVVERISRTPLDIRYLLVGMVGGFQPDKLAAAFEGASDGMYARLCFAWPTESSYKPLAATVTETEPTIIHAFERLVELGGDDPESFEPIDVPLSPAARAAFEEFRKFAFAGKARLYDRERDWWSKMQAHALRLAGTLAFLDWAWAGGEEPKEIAVEFMRAAIILVRNYFWPHSQAAIRQIGVSEQDADARRVLKWIRDEERFEVSREDVRRIALARKLNADDTQTLLLCLARAGWLRQQIQHTGGRPLIRWEVNPQLLGGAS